MRKTNVWKKLEKRLREDFPYPWDEDTPEDDKEWLYDAAEDPLVSFLTGEAAPRPAVLPGRDGIEFVEFEGSFYEGKDYDSIPQGTEDECNAVIRVDAAFYKVGLIFTSYSGYRIDEVAYKVEPKLIEVVIYE